LYPDKRKKTRWEVSPEHVIRFPSLASDVFEAGNRVLSLWLVEGDEWSSMFYEATVTEVIPPSGVNGQQTCLRLCFEGDNQVYEVDRSKAIKFDGSATPAVALGREKGVTSSLGQDNSLLTRRHRSEGGEGAEGESCDSDAAGDDVDGGAYGTRGRYAPYSVELSVRQKKMRSYNLHQIARYNLQHEATLLEL
jgi:hypothetical protein